MDEQSIFLEALEKPSPEAQGAWLDEACGEDESLKRRIKKMLQMQGKAGSFLEQPVQGVEDTEVPDASQGGRAASLDAGLAVSFDDEASVVIGDASHSVLRSLGNTLNEVPRVALRESAAEGAGPIERPGSSEIPKHDFNSRYQLQGEVARGGMGAIIKGRDTDLGRDLAIKVLLDSHKDKPEVIQRFIEEAQIGGQLQHPGIAPIYELGQFADKRPFFAMKLVKGQTLSKMLAGRKDAADGRGQLIGIFEQVCQTMAYAHSRGVIHRDLKPANIMVGAFGEVQVMDWGLAKVLSAGGVADEKKAHDTQQGQSIIQTLRSQNGSDTPGTFGTGGSQTQMGSVMGTPAYMPPEQALGEIDNMDERADVFGLGAILTEILTGKPPYVATDKMDVFRQASRGKLDDCRQRLDSCSADRELVLLTKWCLNLEPSDRPRDAGVLAEQVKEYLESVDTRLRLAELDRVEATTRVAEERKRRKVIMALAASVMLAFGIAGGGWVWMKQKDAALTQARAQAEITAQVRRGQLEQQVAGELSTARTLATGDPGELPNQSSLDRAIAALDRSEDLLDTGEVDDAIEQDVLDLRIELDQIGSDRKLITALEDCWRLEIEHRIASRPTERVTSAPSLANSSLVDDQSQVGTELTEEVELGKPAQAYAAAFLDWGVVPTETTQEEMAQRLSRLPESVRASVLVSLVRWRAQLLTDKTLAQWQAAPWSTLEPIELTSRGGDKLEVLDGKSILASGENAHMGYDLTFETDTTDLSGMRLEALTHESLPNHGPGRSVLGGKRYHYSFYTGVFSLGGLKVWYAPRNAPHQRQRLWFRAAVADYNKSGATDSSLTTENWQIDGGSGEDHVAFFTPLDPPHCEEGFLVTISHEDREKGLWGDQNIGHFRWSVNSNKAEESTIEWLVQAAAENDDDAWRREWRLEKRRGDLASLIYRARDTDSFADQPRIVMAQLAEDLLSNSSASLLSMVEDSEHWTPFSADQIDVGSSKVRTVPFESTDAVVVETQNDGSYVVSDSGSGEILANEQLTLTGQVSNTPYAIKLELIPHLSDEGETFGRGPGGWVELVDVNAELVDDVEGKTKSHLAISQVMSDLPTHRPLRHNDITDNDRQTFCPCYDGGNRHAIVFMCAAPVEPIASAKRLKYLRLKIRTGGAHRHLARFRLSVLNRPIEVPNPADVALDLMRHVQSQDPNDFWTNLAASEMCLQRPSPLFAEALRYATAAVSLRPSDVGGHASILDVLPIDETTLGSPYGVMAKIHANRLWQLDPENWAIPKLKISLGRSADQLADAGKEEQAISKLKLAANLPYANDLISLEQICLRLRKLGDYDSVDEAYQRAIDINPERPRVYSSFGFACELKGDSENAEKMYRKEIALRPDDAGIAYSNLARLVAEQDLDEAIELCQRRIQSAPTDAQIHFSLGTYLRERGDLDDAANAFRQAIEQDPANQSYLLQLAETLAELDQNEEAIKIRKQAIDLSTPASPTRLNSLAFWLMDVKFETIRDPKLALALAKKAVEEDPNSSDLRTTLGIAHYRNGNWRQAVEILNRAYRTNERTGLYVVFLAMAHWQLGEKDEARDWFDKAVQWMDENKQFDASLIQYRAEAEKMLGINTEPVESK